MGYYTEYIIKIITTMKKCNECNVEKGFDKFELIQGKWLRHKCNECRSAKYAPEFRARNPKYFLRYCGPNSRSKSKKSDVYKLYQHFLYMIKRGKKTFVEFGWTREQFEDHISKLFVDGMTWDNWGSVWHINHKRSAVEMIRLGYGSSEINSLDNLEPLTIKDNLKSDRTKLWFTE